MTGNHGCRACLSRSCNTGVLHPVTELFITKRRAD